jgi:hypothetical protein
VPTSVWAAALPDFAEVAAVLPVEPCCVCPVAAADAAVLVELLLSALLLASAFALFDALWAGGASCTLDEDAEAEAACC